MFIPRESRFFSDPVDDLVDPLPLSPLDRARDIRELLRLALETADPAAYVRVAIGTAVLLVPGS
jgi:hypothetical protein